MTKGKYFRTEEHKEKMRIAMGGRNFSPKTTFKKGQPNFKIRGENHPNWKGGINPINNSIRKSLEYRLWRESVFKRYNWTCIWCKERGGKLNADHIKPFSLFPELRFAIDNGRTLCVSCHRKTDTYGKQLTKKQ
jgi:hypothetical protein